MNNFKNGVATFIVPEYFEKVEDLNNFFVKTIDSILKQNDQNFRIVIIDDCSPKNIYYQMVKIVEDFNDKRIQILRNKKNMGPGYCRNIGIKYAYDNNSPFILFNDADDVSHPNRLEKVRKIFSSTKDVDVVYSSFVPIDEKDELINYNNLVLSLKSILDGNKINPIHEKSALIRLGTEKNYTNLTSATAVRTILAYKNPFPKYRVSEDSYTWYNYAANGGWFYYCPDIPTQYRIKNNGSSNTRENKNNFIKIKIKADEQGFIKALHTYSKNNILLKNEKKRILHDFYMCLYKTIQDEASNEILEKLNKKIKRYNDFLDINILENKKYVLQVIVPQNEGSVGGSDTHVLNLSLQQKNNSEYFPIILFTKNSEYLEKIKKLNISYIFSGNCKNKLKLLYLLNDIPTKYDIKIIHSHQYNANYLSSAIKLFDSKHWKKIPLIMTCHGWIENNLKDKYYTFWDFFTYFFSNSLICVSKKDEKRLSDGIFKNKKKYYIPNGVSIEQKYDYSTKEILDKYHLPKDKIIISYIGRLATEKRIDLIIESASLICKDYNNVIFIIVGSGEKEEELKTLIKKKNLEDKVFMTGYISNIFEIYHITDVCVLSSDTEGTPRAILEAMSYQIPVICTNVGGLKDIITTGENGILVEKGDYISLSNKLIELINNEKLRKKYGKSGYKTILKQFDIKKMQHSIDAVYNDFFKGEQNEKNCSDRL